MSDDIAFDVKLHGSNLSVKVVQTDAGASSGTTELSPDRTVDFQYTFRRVASVRYARCVCTLTRTQSIVCLPAES